LTFAQEIDFIISFLTSLEIKFYEALD